MMLALKPERVDMAQAQNFASASQQRAQAFPILGNGKSAKLGWQMQDYNPAGAVGNAAAATAEQGRAVLDAAGRALAQLLAEIDRLPPRHLADGMTGVSSIPQPLEEALRDRKRAACRPCTATGCWTRRPRRVSTSSRNWPPSGWACRSRWSA